MLYICATPIGNLEDITFRAIETLKKSDIILCEDTRNSQKLLGYYGINNKKLVAFHEHNENEVSEKVISWLEENQLIVQISDAGTPGISDPGARLCNKVLALGYKVSPLPGACAFISLISVAGLIDTPFLFHGFLPNKSSQRQKQLQEWKNVNYAIGIYESPHRIVDCLQDVFDILGESTTIVMGRELTKQFETIRKDTIGNILSFVKNDPYQQKGEFVIIIMPQVDTNQKELITPEQIKTLELIAEELPAKKAVNLTNKIVGGDKDALYNFLLAKKNI